MSMSTVFRPHTGSPQDHRRYPTDLWRTPHGQVTVLQRSENGQIRTCDGQPLRTCTDSERVENGHSGRGTTALSRIYRGVSPRGEPTNRGVCPRAGCGLRPNRFPSMAERSGWQTQHGRTHYGRDKGAKPHSVPPATDTCDRNHTIPSPINRRPTPRDHCMARPSASGIFLRNP